MESILTADGVSFHDKIWYPHIEIPKDRTTFICGDSGCGKSTLLKLFNGMISPSSGTIRYQGQDIGRMDTISLRREVTLAGQSVYLFDQTIEKNFEEYYEYRGMPAPDEETMAGFLKVCCADFSLDTNCATMSGGERQRVYLAVFLSFLPKVIMLDEPTSALDLKTGTRLMEHLKQFCPGHGTTLVVVSHDRELTSRFADQVVWLERRSGWEAL